MSIPKNLSKQDLIQAIEKIDKDGVPPDAQSKFYDVIYKRKAYPPKLIVSYANLFANGFTLDRDSFTGGEDTPCFQLLKKNGFRIVSKNDISQLVISFLDRVHNEPDNLKTLDFSDELFGLQVKVSFGQGNQAAIPWIALLGPEQKVSNGIYPVYLYYKQQKTLILAYGVSETHPPAIQWQLNNKTIKDYFVQIRQEIPKRYGESFFFSEYKIDSQKQDFGLSKSILNKDIQKVINDYKHTLSKQMSKAKVPPKAVKRSNGGKPFYLQSFLSQLKEANYSFSDHLVLRFVTALATKPFVILTGLSGSGKTNLALAFAKWIATNENQICLIPVGADWTNREPLLGFPNMQRSETYEYPENGALSTILRAHENLHKPYFLILDEMNLSHVERYFADFLSCMESGGRLALHSGITNWNHGEVPPSILIPPNLFIIGTVNIDETTYMFSPKVLDRASVIEFRISKKEMGAFLNGSGKAKIEDLQYEGAEMSEAFVKLATMKKDLAKPSKLIKAELLKLFDILKKAGAEFGFRTASEIILFSKTAELIGFWEEDERKLMDAIIMQKLLPKVHGSRHKLESILKTLGGCCLEDGHNDELNIQKYLTADEQLQNVDNDDKVKYKISLDKIQRMYACLIANGFTSYAEA